MDLQCFPALGFVRPIFPSSLVVWVRGVVGVRASDTAITRGAQLIGLPVRGLGLFAQIWLVDLLALFA